MTMSRIPNVRDEATRGVLEKLSSATCTHTVSAEGVQSARAPLAQRVHSAHTRLVVGVQGVCSHSPAGHSSIQALHASCPGRSWNFPSGQPRQGVEALASSS
jgi:hypothetical protein